MEDVELPIIVEALRRNARVVAALVSAVGDEQARWRPHPDKWSILEVVSHLADEEVEDFRARVDAALNRPNDQWKPIDPEGWVAARRYNEGNLVEQTERFLTSRAETVSWLEGLHVPDWDVAYDHPRFGPIRAGDLLTAWVAHDHIHIRQINRLQREFLVTEASRYSPRYAGPW